MSTLIENLQRAIKKTMEPALKEIDFRLTHLEGRIILKENAGYD